MSKVITSQPHRCAECGCQGVPMSTLNQSLGYVDHSGNMPVNHSTSHQSALYCFPCIKMKKTAKTIALLGLDNSGKTTIVLKLVKDPEKVIPTLPLQIHDVYRCQKLFKVKDIRGHKNHRSSWETMCDRLDGVMFVIDSNDRERIQEAQEELQQILGVEMLRDAVLLVIANKQDLPNAMKVNEIKSKLKLDQLKNREWFIQATSATRGDGINEAFDALVNRLTSA